MNKVKNAETDVVVPARIKCKVLAGVATRRVTFEVHAIFQFLRGKI